MPSPSTPPGGSRPAWGPRQPTRPWRRSTSPASRPAFRAPACSPSSRGGATWHLDALPGGEDGSLWLIFGDATNGTDTYGGGRYLYTEPPLADGSVVVDFNLAYNMPCVFSPYATCPLPPPQNRLPLRIEAGERRYVGRG